jgi:hypothetical protein
MDVREGIPKLTEAIVCGEFWRNRGGESVRVQLREYQGRVLVDVRVHRTDTDGILKPTTKGVALSIRKLPKLTAAIGKALIKARELGLVEGQP